MTESSRLLLNSLNDNPKKIKYNNNSSIIKKIKGNTNFQNAMKKVAKQHPNGYFEDNIKEGINLGFEDLDLGLSIHKVTNVNVSGVLTDGKGMLTVNLSDNYDFDRWKYKDYQLGRWGIVAINNIANILEGTGAIQKYDIFITFDYCVNCD